MDLLFTRGGSILEGEAAESTDVVGSRFQWRGQTFKSNDSREGLSGPDASGSDGHSALILACLEFLDVVGLLDAELLTGNSSSGQ